MSAATQYHISASGLPAVCRARPGNCPLAGSPHFGTKDEAVFYAETQAEAMDSLTPAERSLYLQQIASALDSEPERLTHESELAKVKTRFYWFQGAYGSHEAIVVDTKDGREYHMGAEKLTPELIAATANRIEAQWPNPGAIPHAPGHFARQAFNRGLGYNEIPDTAAPKAKSSSIEAIEYDESEQLLHVSFVKSGREYSYRGVPKQVAAGFAAAESKGRFFVQHIKDKYKLD